MPSSLGVPTLPPVPVCNDGNGEAGDGCSWLGEVEAFYVCPVGDTCRYQAVCGDGRVEAYEVCDDGNQLPGDGCPASCEPELVPGADGGVADGGASIAPTAIIDAGGVQCGNGIIEGDESCDDGMNQDHYLLNGNGCAPGCRFPHFCGDGRIDGRFGEVCDDGFVLGGYGHCQADCQPGPFCGDGIVNGPESCDGRAGSACSQCMRFLVP